MNLDIKNINTLDEFCFGLGLSAVSLKTIHELQSHALLATYLETDEREQVETIRYEIGRALVAISSLLRLMDKRSVIDVQAISDRLKARYKDSLNVEEH